MHLVHLVLTSPETPQPAPGDAERILDILWARMDPGLGIEHMRARSGPAWIDLGLFFRSDVSDCQDQVATALEHLLPCIPEWTPKVPG
ncbi:hypothetical protein ACWC2T_33960 [Streptomyces sp. NPDC001393]